MKKCKYEKCDNEVKEKRSQYCSLSCSSRDRVWTRAIVTKVCKECGDKFDVDCTNAVKVFCTRSCAAKFNNRSRLRATNCEGCETPIPHAGNGKKKTRRFCTSQCRKAAIIERWKSGEWDGTTKSGLSSTVRNFLLSESGYSCQDGRSGCDGWGMKNPKSGKYALTIDHIDGDCYNNRPENLIVMCPNCHALTETYGALNKGNGRMMRRLSNAVVV